MKVLGLSVYSFREPLREQLVSQGYEVDMVGTKKCGTMKDNVSTYRPSK